MQPLLWLWILLIPPVLALVDLMTSSAKTAVGSHNRSTDHDRREATAY